MYDKNLSQHFRVSAGIRKWSMGILSGHSYLDLYPHILVPDILDLLCRGSEVEQLTYRGWIVEVYRLGEDRSRREMEKSKKAFGLPDTIPPGVACHV